MLNLTGKIGKLNVRDFIYKPKKADAIVVLYWITFFLRFLTNISFNLMSALWLGTGILFFLYTYYRYKVYRRWMLVLLYVDLIGMFSLFVNGNHNPMDAFILITTQGVGIYLYENRRNLDITSLIAFIYIVYLTYKVYTLPKVLISSWQYGIKLSNLVWQNAVSILICMFLSLDLIYRKESNKRINYIYHAIAMLAVIRCEGMGGILSTSAFIIGVVVIYKRKNKISINRVLLISLTIITIITCFKEWPRLIREITDDNSRFYIWGNYLKFINNPVALIFGAGVEENEFLYSLKNMHNEVLNWHYYYGLVPTIFFLYMWMSAINHYVKTSNGTMIVIQLVTILRAMTDKTTYCFMVIWTFSWIYAQIEKTRPMRDVLMPIKS